MANPFDKFDAPKKTGNPFDQFDGEPEMLSSHEPGVREVSPSLARTVMDYARPALEGAGMVGGGIVGLGSGVATGPAAPAAAPLLTVAGGGLGYAIGKRAADTAEEMIGLRQPETIPQAAATTAKDIGTGAAMEMTGQAIVPGAAMIGRGGGNVGKEIIGKMTGAGPEAIAQAVKGNKGFAQAMRGGEGVGEQVLSDTRAALGQVKADRGVTYSAQFAEVAKNKKSLDPSPFRSKIAQTLQKFNIRATIDPKTGKILTDAETGKPLLDFSRSSITDDAAKVKAAKMIEDFNGWGSQADDFTPTGLDLLKRRTQDYYDPNAPSIANMSTDLSNFVKGNIIKEVPEYAKMVKGYEESTRFINEAERALSLGNKAMMDTSIKKLLSTNRENFEFRRELLKQIEERAGRSLSPEIAGLTMQQYTPKGLMGVLGATGSGAAAVTGTVNPTILAVAAMSSPRLAGEFLYTFAGIPRREVAKILASRQFQQYAEAVRAAAKPLKGAAINEATR